MRTGDILNIAIKVIGVYYIAKLLQHVIELILMITAQQVLNYNVEHWLMFSGIVATCLVDFIIAFFFTSKSEILVSKILKNDIEIISLNSSKSDIMEIAFILIGSVIIAISIPATLVIIINQIYQPETSPESIWSNRTSSGFLYSLLSLAIGALLITNAKFLAAKISKVDSIEEKSD